jgi:hypothetical protein
MNRKLWILALVGAVLLSAAPVLAEGDFYVVAAGGGVGTKITSLPYTISSPGFYYLTGNLTCTSGSGIRIQSDDVTLDLMGFRLKGNSGGNGIYMQSGDSFSNVVIRNGRLRDWDKAISMYGFLHRISNVTVQANTGGIILLGFGHEVRGCTAFDNTDIGIQASDSVIRDNVVGTGSSGNYGIFGYGIISGNKIQNYATGIYCHNGPSNVIGNLIWGAGSAGIHLPSDAAVVDQNTVSGFSATPYAGGSTATIWAGKNSDNPWGSNAGHQTAP